MTPQEKLIAKNLARCTFVPGTPPKRFAREMAYRAEHGTGPELTEPQRKYLFDLLHRFRRQIPKTHEKHCRNCKGEQP